MELIEQARETHKTTTIPMAISHFSGFILSIFFFSNVLITQSSHNMNTPLIHKTCKKIAAKDSNISFDFCSSSLHFATKHRRHCNLRRLGLLSIALLRSNVTNTHRCIPNLMRSKRLDPFIRSCLVDCLELYSDSIPTVKHAMRDYRLKRYADANVAITSVMDAASTCEDGFKEKKGASSPLKKRDEDAFELGAIALAIMSLLLE